jgi:hypothetical protein
MIEDDEFFVYLPSNSSLSLFPNNTLTSYKVQLARPIHLKGKYIVGLREIHYPMTWASPNIQLEPPPEDELYMVLNKISTLEPLGHRHGFACVNSNPRPYESLDELVETINQEIKSRRLGSDPQDPFHITRKTDKPKLVYNSQSSCYVIHNDIDERVDQFVQLVMSPRLAQRFGFKPEQVSLETSAKRFRPMIHAKTHMRPQWNFAFDYLYVYCDLIRYSIVGDVYAPLLRIIDVRGNPGDSVTIDYERPLYHEVRKSNFESIEILILDDQGRPIPFQHNQGRVTCVLHFMKVNEKI